MKQILGCLLLGLAIASASKNPVTVFVNIFTIPNKVPTRASINGHVDEALIIASNLTINNGFYKNFNPLDLPDAIISGGIKLTEVKQYGLHDIYRFGDAAVTYDDSFIYLSFTKGYKELNTVAKYRLLFISQGTLTAKINGFEYLLSFRIDRRTFHASLDNFQVKFIGPIDVKLEGKGLIDSVLALVVNLLADLFEEQHKAFVGPQIKLLIEDFIKEHNKVH